MIRDLRADLKKILDEVGYPVVYVRQDQRFRCDCYVERSGESGSGCPKCYGTGYRVSIQKRKSYRKPNAVPLSLSGVNQQSPAGRLTPKAFVYYLEHDADPKENDLILEVEWQGDVPIKIIDKQEISFTEPKKGKDGRVEFHQTYTRSIYKGGGDDAALSEH